MRVAWFLVFLVLAAVNEGITQVIVSETGNITIPDLRTIFTNFENVADVSQKCSKQLSELLNSPTLLMTMLDASAKFPYPGLGFATKMQYGHYDQCLTIDHQYEGGRILGEHCTIGLIIPDVTDDMTDTNTYFKLGICRPNACSGNDFVAIIKEKFNISLPLFIDLLCQTKETYKTFTTGDIVTIIIFAIFVALMFLSTLYDIIIFHKHMKSAHPLLTAFSILSNGRKLLHISRRIKSKEQIETFHGLRVISMMWIVAGHGFVAWQSVSATDRYKIDNWLYQRYAGYIQTAPLAVDTFFFMSGFLLAFQYLKHKGKPAMKQIKSIPHMMLHRYLRLTPAMLMVYLLIITLFKHMGDGPLWTQNEPLAKSCRDNWWSFFLYIQNYYNYDDLCLTQTWYLSADMQMFLISPLILIPLSITLNRKSGFALSMIEFLGLNIIFIILPMAIGLCFPDYGNTYGTHERLINYFIGMMLGVYMREKIDKPFLHVFKDHQKYLMNIVIWVVILLGMIATVACYQEMEMNHPGKSKTVFYALMRPAWCTGLSWIVYSCYHGYGGIVNWILCRPIFQILGRLTYCTYLLHGQVIVYYVLTTRVPWFFSDYNAFYLFCGHYVVSMILAIFWTLAFESPLIIIEKYLLGGSRKPPRPKPSLSAPPKKEYVGETVEKSHDNEDTEELPTRDIETGGVHQRQYEKFGD